MHTLTKMGRFTVVCTIFETLALVTSTIVYKRGNKTWKCKFADNNRTPVISLKETLKGLETFITFYDAKR